MNSLYFSFKIDSNVLNAHPDKEVIEIDKSLGDYKEPKQTIAGWSFGWK